jgi:hypothetical protein
MRTRLKDFHDKRARTCTHKRSEVADRKSSHPRELPQPPNDVGVFVVAAAASCKVNDDRGDAPPLRDGTPLLARLYHAGYIAYILYQLKNFAQTRILKDHRAATRTFRTPD